MSFFCGICQNALQAESYAVRCGHVFHNACIMKWLTISERGGCPECRSNICPSKEIFRLYLNVAEENGNENSVGNFQSNFENEIDELKATVTNIEEKMKSLKIMLGTCNANLVECRKKVKI